QANRTGKDKGNLQGIRGHQRRAKDDERDPKHDEREEQLEAKILTCSSVPIAGLWRRYVSAASSPRERPSLRRSLFVVPLWANAQEVAVLYLKRLLINR